MCPIKPIQAKRLIVLATSVTTQGGRAFLLFNGVISIWEEKCIVLLSNAWTCLSVHRRIQLKNEMGLGSSLFSVIAHNQE